MAAASAIAAAIVTQAIGVLLSVFVGLLCAWSVLHRRWRQIWAYGVVAAAIAGVVLAVFILSYVQTGMASDQPLDLMLRFADVGRLDRWGVIPQVIAIAWIRDNYLALAPPFIWLGDALKQLCQFMRLQRVVAGISGPVPIVAASIIYAIGQICTAGKCSCGAAIHTQKLRYLLERRPRASLPFLLGSVGHRLRFWRGALFRASSV